MPTRHDLGGIVHSYQAYDPARIPSPRPPQIDLVSPAMEHLLEYGELDELTPEQLASAVLLDPEQIRGLGPSIESLKRMLEARKRKILEHWDAAGDLHHAVIHRHVIGGGGLDDVGRIS